MIPVHWQVQEAKQRFSEVVRAAASGEPQIVTRHGQEIAVVIDIELYRHLRGESMTLMEFLGAAPVLDDDLDIERSAELPRDVDLAD